MSGMMLEESIHGMSSTPSPTASASASASSSSAPRRPPRKSTLTQQQKNQKRQRATQDQLTTLEVEFNKNPTPTALVRERIAQDINMTERSVQIWFQNRRAKIKLLAKKSIETGEECDAIPDSMRQYLAVQAMESGKGLNRDFMGRHPMPQFSSASIQYPEASNSSKVVIQHFACRSLSIGTWRRVGQNTMDLVIFYSPEKACITYYINNDSAGYKIEYPFSHVKSITLDPGDMSNEQGNGQKPGGLIIELNRPPMFFMDSSGSGGFYQCGDFTEEQQASQIMTHHLGGHPKVLSGQLTKLAALESFQNRHAQYDQPPAISASAPVSPLPLRPASQPSAAPHPQVGMFPESQYGMSLQPTARGHKRQRSRSVPIAVDFSLLHPMQSFHLPQQQAAPPNLQPPNLYAPIPQHHTNLGNMGSNLRIDTTTGYGLDFRQYPMSAATTTSPSDYASPFFTTGSTQDGMTAVDYNSPYSLPFLSPMIDPSSGMIAPSVSPLSMNHGDPIIANQSPPLSMHNITRSASADIFHMSTHDGSALTEDGISLSDLYSKQSLMPMHSPGMETHVEDMDMHQMVSFASLDADNVPMTP